MISFLPSIFPNAGGNGKISIAIPNYDASVEQRSHYPYTYTSVKTVEDGSYTTYSAHSSSLSLPNPPKKHQNTYSASASASASALASSATVTTPVQTLKPKTLSGIIIIKMDPLAALYSPEWMSEIEQEFRDKIRSFLSEDDVSKVLGKTRCRDCLYYFEKSSMKPSKTRVKSIGMFLSFWWGKTVKVGDTYYRWSKLPKETLLQQKTDAIELSHLDNGEWVHTH